MITETISVTGNRKEIDLGLRTENNARCIYFDVEPWVQLYGADGVFQLKHKPYGAEAYYPIACVLDRVNNTVAWELTEVDTGTAGVGEVQLIYNYGTVYDVGFDTTGQACSRVWQTYVHRSLTATEEAPDPYRDWVEEVQVAVNTASQAAGAAEDAAEAASTAASTAAQEAAAEVGARLTSLVEDAAASAEAAEQSAREVAQSIEAQIQTYLNDPVHQEEIARSISSAALETKVDKEEILAVLEMY